jgi:hypothetical protein
MVEAAAVLVLLAALLVCIVAVGRLQWSGLSGAHATRIQAFRYALGERVPSSARSGVRRQPQPAFLGPGGMPVTALRRELDVEDKGIVTAMVALPVHVPHVETSRWAMRRHTSILADAGHAASDRQAQHRIAASPQAWRRVAAHGLAAGRQAASRFKGVDRAWSRPAPDFDWLTPWADLVPPGRVRTNSRRQGER